ncbi:MAG: TlpA family protein disulfide reductase [Caulobacterales bacterium]
MGDLSESEAPSSPNPPPGSKPVRRGLAFWAGRGASWMALGAVIVFLMVMCQAGQSVPPAAERGGLLSGPMATFSTTLSGRAAPATLFFGPDGAKTATLTGGDQKLTVVNLWATWCAPCVREMPTLATLQTAFADQGVKVMALSVDRAEDRTFAAEELARLSGGVLKPYADPTYAVVYEIGEVKGFPTTVIYNAAGKEVGRIHETDWSTPEARAVVEAALRGEAVR